MRRSHRRVTPARAHTHPHSGHSCSSCVGPAALRALDGVALHGRRTHTRRLERPACSSQTQARRQRGFCARPPVEPARRQPPRARRSRSATSDTLGLARSAPDRALRCTRTRCAGSPALCPTARGLSRWRPLRLRNRARTPLDSRSIDLAAMCLVVTAIARSTYWSHLPDSNRRPTHYECVALPTELRWRTAFWFRVAIARAQRLSSRGWVLFDHRLVRGRVGCRQGVPSRARSISSREAHCRDSRLLEGSGWRSAATPGPIQPPLGRTDRVAFDVPPLLRGLLEETLQPACCAQTEPSTAYLPAGRARARN